MRGKGRSGEGTPLMGRDSSTFRLYQDTHVLAKKPSAAGESQRPTTEDEHKNHVRNASNLTQMSGGNVTNLSTGGLGKKERRRRRRNKRLQVSLVYQARSFPDFLCVKTLNLTFTHHTKTKILIGICYVLVFAYTCVVLVGPLLLSFQEESDWCPLYIGGERNPKSSGAVFNWDIPIQDREYNNPDFDQDPCHYARVPQLVWLTLQECDMSRRMLTSVILGGAIGYERRTSDRPAGIRTMGLVSLGACFFTISSIIAFRSSTMGWDASRVTAALPSGVGFLGAALIWKGSIGDGDEEVHQVHGLTTAAR